jgi:hypothetical protein
MMDQLPVLVDSWIRFQGLTVSLNVTTYDVFMKGFPDAVSETWCTGQCHRAARLKTSFGQCRVAFEGPDFALKLFIVELDEPITTAEVLLDYEDPGWGEEYDHQHSGRRHVAFRHIGLDLALTAHGLVERIGFGLNLEATR